MKDEAEQKAMTDPEAVSIILGLRSKVIARDDEIAALVNQLYERDTEIERLKKLDEIGIKAHNANLLEMADMRAVIHRLKAERDAAYVRGLERAANILEERFNYDGGLHAIQAEIDKAKAGGRDKV